MDKATQQQLDRGARMTELLKQGRYAAMNVEDQVVSICAGNMGFLDAIPVSEVVRFREELVEYMHANKSQLLAEIVAQGKLTDELKEAVKEAIAAFAATFAVEG